MKSIRPIEFDWRYGIDNIQIGLYITSFASNTKVSHVILSYHNFSRDEDFGRPKYFLINQELNNNTLSSIKNRSNPQFVIFVKDLFEDFGDLVYFLEDVPIVDCEDEIDDRNPFTFVCRHPNNCKDAVDGIYEFSAFFKGQKNMLIPFTVTGIMIIC